MMPEQWPMKPEFHDENVQRAKALVQTMPSFGYMYPGDYAAERIADLLDERDRHWSDKWTQAIADETIEAEARADEREKMDRLVIAGRLDAVLRTREETAAYLSVMSKAYVGINDVVAEALDDAAEDVRCGANDLSESCMSEPQPSSLPRRIELELKWLREVGERGRAWQQNGTEGGADMVLSEAIAAWRTGMKTLRNEGMGIPQPVEKPDCESVICGMVRDMKARMEQLETENACLVKDAGDRRMALKTELEDIALVLDLTEDKVLTLLTKVRKE